MRIPVAEVVVGDAPRAVTFDEDAGRFEVEIPGAGSAVMKARLSGTSLSILHTEVPPAMRGQGVGETLARAALDYARTRRWTIQPYCPFVAGFVARRPEYAAMVDPSFVTPGDA